MKAECAERDRLDNALGNSASSQQLVADNKVTTLVPNLLSGFIYCVVLMCLKYLMLAV
jgi:hypothetical protein